MSLQEMLQCPVVVLWSCGGHLHPLYHTQGIFITLKTIFMKCFGPFLYWHLKQRYIFSTIILTRLAVVVLGLDE